jgi:hypothetical protein
LTGDGDISVSSSLASSAPISTLREFSGLYPKKEETSDFFFLPMKPPPINDPILPKVVPLSPLSSFFLI